MINGTCNRMLQPGEFVLMIPITHEFLLCGTPKSAFCLFCQSFILVLFISMCYPETAIWYSYSSAGGWIKSKLVNYTAQSMKIHCKPNFGLPFSKILWMVNWCLKYYKKSYRIQFNSSQTYQCSYCYNNKIT